MKTPNSFKVFATTIKVQHDNIRLSNESNLGDCSYTDNLISLCSIYKGEKITDSAVADTLYHEKIHVILDAMGEHKLSSNEKFVEIFSRLIRQSDETSEY